MKCKAFENREVTEAECLRNKREIPEKFCIGCPWLKEAKERKPYTPSKYIIRLSKKLRDKVAEESRKRNMSPAKYMAKIIAEKLSGGIY